MATRIQITPDEMDTQAKTFTTDAATAEAMMRKLDQLVQSMQGRWQGKAHDKFVGVWPGHKKEMANLVTDLRDVGAQLKATAAQLRQADVAAAGRIR